MTSYRRVSQEGLRVRDLVHEALVAWGAPPESAVYQAWTDLFCEEPERAEVRAFVVRYASHASAQHVLHRTWRDCVDAFTRHSGTLDPKSADARALHAEAQSLREAFVPNKLFSAFERSVIGLPRNTATERLVIQRVGQDLFRAGLLDYWEGRCAITGLAVPELLRASHIKPWADCDTDSERLDVFNGLLLAPHLDAAFDRGFITVADDGEVVVSKALSAEARTTLGLVEPLRVSGLTGLHQTYLPWHRTRVFKEQT